MLTFAVFLLVSWVTAGLAARIWLRRRRAFDRLVPSIPVKPSGSSPALAWRELVTRLGAAMPASPKGLSELKKRLVRAGIRNPSALRTLRGARFFSVALMLALGLFLGIRRNSSTDNLVLQAGALAMLGYMAPGLYLSWRIGRRQHAIQKGLPNALDLMVVCVESGLGLDQTTIQVAKELQGVHPEICDEFTLMNVELRAGKRRADALHDMAERTGVGEVKKLVAVLVQTDRFGTSIAQCLRGHAEYLRSMSRQRAEERAAKMAVKLVFPIFFCILPSLFVVTVGPVMTQLIRELMPAIENM